MLPRFFIDRPIFAWVIALIILAEWCPGIAQPAGSLVSVGGSARVIHHA